MSKPSDFIDQYLSDKDRYRNVKQAVRDAFLHMMIIIFLILSLGLGAWTVINKEKVSSCLVKFDKWVEKK